MCYSVCEGCGGKVLFAGGLGGAGSDALCALCMLEIVEGGLCLLEVLGVMRCVLLCMLEVPETMRCVLLCWRRWTCWR